MIAQRCSALGVATEDKQVLEVLTARDFRGFGLLDNKAGATAAGGGGGAEGEGSSLFRALWDTVFAFKSRLRQALPNQVGLRLR